MNRTLLLSALLGATAYLAWLMTRQGGANYEDETMIDATLTTFDQVAGAFSGPGPIANMMTSHQAREMLKKREQLRLTRYNLGDGGWTIGYGHFERNINDIPATITRVQAEAMFDKDLVERGEKWVKLYVTVPLTQYQFDSLVSIAYNMSPRSFKKFAESVNAGQGIDMIAQESVSWVAAKFTNGIQNRRDEEMALFNNGVYA